MAPAVGQITRAAAPSKRTFSPFVRRFAMLPGLRGGPAPRLRYAVHLLSRKAGLK